MQDGSEFQTVGPETPKPWEAKVVWTSGFSNHFSLFNDWQLNF